MCLSWGNVILQEKIKNSARADNSKILSSHEEEEYWTEDRLELWQWFQRRARSLGEIYLGAVKMTYGSSFPGRTRFVSHAVREIRNRLPEIISGSRSSYTVQYKNRLDEIPRGWEKAGLPLDGSLPLSVTDAEIRTSNSETIPRQLFLEIGTLIREHNNARQKPVDTAKRLFLGATSEDPGMLDSLRPVINQWLDVSEWFVKKVHDSGGADDDFDADEFRDKFEVFETTLRALLRSFFATVEELDEILEDTNS